MIQSIEIPATSSETSVVAEVAWLAGAFFSFRVFIMLLSVRVLGTDPQTGTGISLVCNFALLGLVIFQSVGSGGRTLRSLLQIPSIRWVFCFLCFSGISLLWSVADSPFAATAYWCALTADVVIVALLVCSSNPTPVIHALMRGYVCGACVLAVIAWLLPIQSDLRLGDEELLGSNQIGYLCGFAFFFAQYLLREKIGKFGIATIILGLTLLRSLSKTTLVAFLLAQGFLLLRDTSMSRKTKLSLIALTAFIAVAFSGLLTSYFDIYSNAGNSPETLTGRLGIWAVFLEEAIQKPWFGHGFYSVWQVIPPFGLFEARHAHNEPLQQFYLYGIAGLILLAGLYGSFFFQIRRITHIPQRAFFYALLLFVLVRGLADTEVYDISLPLWAILMFSILIAQARPTPGKESRELPG